MDRAVTEAKPFIACLLAAVAVLGLGAVGCSDMRSASTAEEGTVAPTEAADSMRRMEERQRQNRGNGGGGDGSGGY